MSRFAGERVLEHENSSDNAQPIRPGSYGYSDLSVGAFYHTAGVTVTEAHVVGFAGISGDLFDVHMDDDFAKAAGFPGRIAHGLLGLALADGLKTRSKVHLKGIATLSWNWSFQAPLLIGDRIHARIEILGIKPTKKENRGIVTLGMTVLNTRSQVVQSGESLLLMEK